MMYVIYNNDGSIKSKFLNEFVMQGNNNVNELFVAIEGREDYSLYASFKLPNGSTTTVVSSTPTTEFIEGLGTFTGRKILLSNAETLVAGALQMNVVCLDENDAKIVAFSTYITVNETGIQLSDPVLLTVQEYENLISEIKAKMSYPTKYVQVTTLPDNPDLDTIYVLKGEDDLNEVFMFNGKTESWIPLGSNRINLGNYYTKEEGENFEEGIEERVSQVESELSSVASGSPKGVYATLAALQAAYPTGTSGIYVVLADGHWYYWSGSAWADGGVYLSTGNAVPETRKVANYPLTNDITSKEIAYSTHTDIAYNLLGSKNVTYITNEATQNGTNFVSTINKYAIPFNKSFLNGDIDTIISKVAGNNTTQLKCAILDENMNVVKETSYETVDTTLTEKTFSINCPLSIIPTDTFFVAFITPNGTDIQINVGTVDDYLNDYETYIQTLPSGNQMFFGTNVSDTWYGQNWNYKKLYVKLNYKKPNKAITSEELEEAMDGFVSKSELGFEEKINPNIWNKNDEVSHSWASPSNGEISNYPDNPSVNNYLRSGYMNVEYNETYIFSLADQEIGGSMFVCFYDKNKNFISSLSFVNVASFYGQTISVPNNNRIKYMIISYNQNDHKGNEQVEKGTTITSYQPYTGDKYYLNNVAIKRSQLENEEQTSYIYLPEKFLLVVDDTFELFFKGIINVKDYKNYYVEAICSIGNSYERLYSCTPTNSQIGNHTLRINIYDDNRRLLETKTTTLVVVAKATSPLANKNVLCIGDSLTAGGYWVQELQRRLCLTTSIDYLGHSAPTGLGLSNINFVGKCSSQNGTHFEGYGGWNYELFIDANTPTMYWVSTTSHDKTSADQESIWKDTNNVEWQLETIEANRLKFKKYSGNGVMPASGTLTWVSGGTHTSNIVFVSSSIAEGNPFAYNGQIDFEAYCDDLGIDTIDIVFILLGWNSGNLFMTNPNTYKSQIETFVGYLRTFNPDIKICLLGLEIPSLDGMGKNYGASNFWTYEKQQKFVLDLGVFYEEIANSYNTGVSYSNVSGQFDTEYNMQYEIVHPNTRNVIEIQRQSNGVHPALEGYFQIADVVYRWICANIND